MLLYLSIFLITMASVSESVERAPKVGGPVTQDPEEYVAKAWKSVTEVTRESNGDTLLVPIKVIKAHTLMVAGTKAEMEVLFGESSCQKSLKASEINATNCQYKKGGSRAIYSVSIWEKLWENFEEITVKKIRDVPDSEII